jgi:hypothetical protein
VTSLPLASRELAAADLLRLWEVGAAQHPLDRALSILAATEPDWSRHELARLPFGRRDARLLAVHERTFGRLLAGQAACPACGERVEFALDVRDLLAASVEGDGTEPFTLEHEGYTLRWRLPDSFDLAAIATLADVAEARQRLLERCLVEATLAGARLSIDQVPEPVVALVVEQMAARDPLAMTELAMACPACGLRWELVFDIAAFLWIKIEAQGRRLLREVHTLARAYGWPEADILALSPARRRAYLELVS